MPRGSASAGRRPILVILMGVSVLLKTALLAGCVSLGLAQTPPLVATLAVELDRNFRLLKEKADPAPYYIAYEVTEQESASASATLGALTSTRTERGRRLDITVRVGTPKLDSYHHMPGDSARFTAGIPLAIEDSPAAIQRTIWLETDRIYRLAAERLIKVRNARQMNVKEEDDSDDFSNAPPAVYSEPVVRLSFATGEMAARARKWSAGFAGYPGVLTSFAALAAQRETRYFVDTEGARLRYGRGYAGITLFARAKAADGMDLASSETFAARDLAGLPKDDLVLAAAGRVSKDVTDMLRAPLVDPFVGPAILSGRAAAVLFHEILGHRIEGHRQKDETEGQTFTKKLGEPVLPDFLSVIFDPTRLDYRGVSLNGSYLYDDEGVKAQPVTAVDKGILKTFLMSRSPIRGIASSNGHGRRAPGFEVVSRQSNLFVEAAQTVSEARLRELLIAEIKRQNKPYGLYFQQVTGGYTTTGRQGLQAFTVIPVVLYRVYADGRPDELVRGADVVGTPLASFAKILAASDRPEVFNGYCGAESGSVPVSAVSPAILVSEIEIQKKEKSQDRPPYLSAPALGGPQ
jgi:predicted Zn-dependent protease